jgi:hypothetical protein
MKRCPTCRLTFTDSTLSFCTDDGTPLVDVLKEVQPPVNHNRENEGEAVGYRTPHSHPPAVANQRRAWPWVLGIGGLLLVFLIGITVGLGMILPRLKTNSASESRPPVAAPTVEKANTNAIAPNANTGSATTHEGNANSANAESNSTPPTNNDEVLAQLTQLEHEWTIANINADKVKLMEILADDYVGTLRDQTLQGKADYLRTLERNTTIEKWDFRDLDLTLRGERATLSGKIHLFEQGTERVLEFTDRFIWRANRWQATGSEVKEIERDSQTQN